MESLQEKSLSQKQQENSAQDICFDLNSRLLFKGPEAKQQIKPTLSYSTSFKSLREGFIDKKTLNSQWQSRYFVLTPFRFIYYLDQSKKQLKGCFNLASLIEHSLTITEQHPFLTLSIKIKSNKQENIKILLLLQIENPSLFWQWKNSLSQTIFRLSSIQDIHIFPQLTSLQLQSNNQKIGNSNGNFWNKISISVDQLFQYSSHLDILFFKNKSPFSCVHRFFMRSDYDHVGVLFRDEGQKLYLLEAVQNKGVCITPLTNVIQSFYEDYEELAYRKLIIEDKSKISLPHLQSYINSIIGKKYQLSLSKLILGNETEDQEISDEESQAVERTYFCSELVADIYLKFNVFSQGKSCKFWPRQFQTNDLPLNPQYRLSPLMKVQIPLLQNSEISEQ